MVSSSVSPIGCSRSNMRVSIKSFSLICTICIFSRRSSDKGRGGASASNRPARGTERRGADQSQDDVPILFVLKGLEDAGAFFEEVRPDLAVGSHSRFPCE